MKSYAEYKSSNYITNLGAIKFYGWAMVQCLTTGIIVVVNDNERWS